MHSQLRNGLIVYLSGSSLHNAYAALIPDGNGHKHHSVLPDSPTPSNLDSFVRALGSYSQAAQNQIIPLILNAGQADLRKLLEILGDPRIQASSWSEQLAKKVLEILQQITSPENVDKLHSYGQTVVDAYNKAVEAAKKKLHDFYDYAREHPGEVGTALAILLAVGMLAVLAPYLLEFLGFAVTGPVKGEFSFPPTTYLTGRLRYNVRVTDSIITYFRILCSLVPINLWGVRTGRVVDGLFAAYQHGCGLNRISARRSTRSIL